MFSTAKYELILCSAELKIKGNKNLQVTSSVSLTASHYQWRKDNFHFNTQHFSAFYHINSWVYEENYHAVIYFVSATFIIPKVKNPVLSDSSSVAVLRICALTYISLVRFFSFNS